MHRHLAGGFGEGDQRRAVARDPPDVQIVMSPRAREPLVQLGAVRFELRDPGLVRIDVVAP